MSHRDLVDLGQLSQFFHLPITEASKELGICATALKKICRRHGIPRWPARKIRSIDKMIAGLEESHVQNPEDEGIVNEIQRLKKRRLELILNPSLASIADDRRISKPSAKNRSKTIIQIKDKEEGYNASSSPDITNIALGGRNHEFTVANSRINPYPPLRSLPSGALSISYPHPQFAPIPYQSFSSMLNQTMYTPSLSSIPSFLSHPIPASLTTAAATTTAAAAAAALPSTTTALPASTTTASTTNTTSTTTTSMDGSLVPALFSQEDNVPFGAHTPAMYYYDQQLQRGMRFQQQIGLISNDSKPIGSMLAINPFYNNSNNSNNLGVGAGVGVGANVSETFVDSGNSFAINSSSTPNYTSESESERGTYMGGYSSGYTSGSASDTSGGSSSYSYGSMSESDSDYYSSSHHTHRNPVSMVSMVSMGGSMGGGFYDFPVKFEVESGYPSDTNGVSSGDENGMATYNYSLPRNL